MIYKNEDITKIRPKNKYTFIKFLLIAFILLLIIVVAITLYSAFLISTSISSNDDEYVFNMKAYIIETSSMEPELYVGDVIIVKKCESIDDIKNNDIITFKNRGEVVTHRVKSISAITKKITTKGDKNTIADIEGTKIENVIGKMIIKIPRFNAIEKILRTIICVTVLLIILITIFMHNRRISRKQMLRRMKKKTEDKKDEESN